MGEHHHRGTPTGTVSFLFTDIEGSTPLWENHPDAMRAALERHDAILRQALEDHGGFVFSTAGDAFSAAFGRAGAAVDAALAAQRALHAEPWPEDALVKVRMGVHTGEAQERDGDYFGSAVNRAARLMGLAHGGQVLVSLAMEELVRDDLPEGVGLKGLGEHALKGLSRPETVFQLTAPGLVGEFAALSSAISVPGNLPAPPTSFVGRALEVAELVGLLGAHRLVTLTGVGGVGKTRLAVEVAAEVTGEFPDGVWLIELAPVGDPAAVPDAVATVLGITPQPDLTVTANIARALSGRRLLVVLDNCEHVLDAAADLVETVLAGTDSVNVLATSREGLRVGAEQLWPVPSLDPDSAAVELFVDRALAVNPSFDLTAPGVAEAVTEICERLDGIALGIELAAARTVSMSAQDIRDRLDDRFRLLAGSRRGLERHQTLRHAVGWSFDLLEDDERVVLCRCAVFADGFDLAAAAHLCEEIGLDEYAVLDTLDSLVRKSLVTVGHHGGHARYGMLETIRQYAEDQLAAGGDLAEVRDRHAAYFAAQAQAYWAIWNGPDQRVALDWVDAEFANLRAGFGWALDRGDLAPAGAIAAHTAMMAFVLLRFEPVEWAEQILDAASGADIAQLPRLYTAAGLCLYITRADRAIGHAHRAVALEADARYDPFEPGWSRLWEGVAHLLDAGHPERAWEIFVEMIAQPGLAHVLGLAHTLTVAVAAGRGEEAMAVADDAVAATRAHGSPWLIALALLGAGRVFNQADPDRALRDLTEGLACCRAHRLVFYEALIAREAAGLEGVHGDLETGLALFDGAIDSQFRAGSLTQLAATAAGLAVLFDRLDRPEIAATIYGTSAHEASTAIVAGLPSVLQHLCATLGDAVFDDCVAVGAAMETGEAVRYVRAQIQAAQPTSSTDMTATRPTGTVSFLFTDIEGSTPLWERHPDAMRQALERHDAILRAAIDAHGGFVFSTAGDAFSAAFDTPGGAVGAALDAQRALQTEAWPDEASVRVRMGVHLGTVQERDGDYFGSAVNRAARLMGLAHGGQVLVSLAVEELVRDDLADGIGLLSLGEHGLRGLSRPETVFQLTAPGLVGEFLALAAATSVPGNLPLPPTSFVGRVEETKRLVAEIPAHRLVTLVGPGGVGKTRLSIEAAAAVTDEFPDGVWFVELAPVGEPDAVVHAVASTLSVSPEAGSTLLESIVDALSGRRVLVVLDNCEHVIDAAAEIAAAVSVGAPKATIVATSREPLGVAGERVWMMSALDSTVEARELFCERAAAADQRFEPSDADLELIGGICERLDGMPLAIELAASRVRSMSLVQLADRLADRFRLLRSSARGGTIQRHATLRATVEWSYRLLGADEQVLFDRLSVFAGGFDLDGAEAVCGFDPIDEMDVFDLLGSLFDKSLVVLDRDTGRYRLLETLRQYGTEQLEERGEADVVRDRHLDHYVEVAGRARDWFEGTRSADGRELFEVEWDNLRAALDCAEAAGDEGRADRLVRDPWWFALFNLRDEHDRWAQRRAVASAVQDPEILGVAAGWRYFLADLHGAERLSAAAIDAAPDRAHPTTAIGWFMAAATAWLLGRVDAAAAADRAAKRAAAQADPATAIVVGAWMPVLVALDPNAAPAAVERVRRRARAVGNGALDAYLAVHAGHAAYAVQDVGTAVAEWRRAVELGASSGNPNMEGFALVMLASRAGDLAGEAAESLFREAIRRLHQRAANTYVLAALTGLAGWWAARGQFVEAARVVGHLDQHDPGGHQMVATERAAATAAVDSRPDLARWRAEGAEMTRDEIVAWCLEHLGAG